MFHCAACFKIAKHSMPLFILIMSQCSMRPKGPISPVVQAYLSYVFQELVNTLSYATYLGKYSLLFVIICQVISTSTNRN